ncbi:MAG: hypothetical protein VX705_06780 [Verrucomicrobiota bacterium]|nr:hypothetical protein [Verrucomicrobiota bacterium]
MKKTIFVLVATTLVASLHLGCSKEEDLTGHDEFMATNAPPPSGPPGSTIPAPPIDP